jgi:L-amino acid N-acyltransferase YncA
VPPTLRGANMIRSATPGDGDAVATIYNHYVANTIVTFEEEPVSAGQMAGRIADAHDQALPWLVLEEVGSIVGYAYASQWKARSAYRYAVEVTVYLAPDAAGRGFGTQLYAALFAQLRSRSIHTAIGGIALPNPASIALHEKFGMTKVAHFAEVGFKLGQWIDVGYWQKRVNE